MNTYASPGWALATKAVNTPVGESNCMVVSLQRPSLLFLGWILADEACGAHTPKQ